MGWVDNLTHNITGTSRAMELAKREKREKKKVRFVPNNLVQMTILSRIISLSALSITTFSADSTEIEQSLKYEVSPTLLCRP